MVKFQMVNKLLLFFCCILFVFSSFAQKNSFQYERKIDGVKSRWGYFLLPEGMYEKVNPDFSDIRIYELKNEKDSVETAYWIESTAEQPKLEKVQFNVLNTTQNQDGYFFTFETDASSAINEIDIKFQQKNYDWTIRLEGSNDPSSWFTIVDNYRLLSIKNDQTDYAFTTVSFKDVKFKYFRLLAKTKEEVKLDEVSLLQKSPPKSVLTNYKNIVYKSLNDRKLKQTKINIDLPFAVPVSSVKLFVKKNFDYFRTVSLDYVSDSFKTEKGYQYEFAPISSGALNSKEDNILQFENTIVKRLQLTIENQDNQPLTIDSIHILGSPYKLVGNFLDSSAQYVLLYGNSNLTAPQYDIAHFKTELPSDINELTLESEIRIASSNSNSKTSIPIDKVWLWVVMVVLILLLGFFAFRMLKKTSV